jgi:hypothetical protein
MSATTVADASARERLQIIQSARSAALVGISANPIRSSNFVATYLVRTPMRTYPVNPAYDEVLGLECYPTLADLPEPPDIVDIFRRPDAIPAWSTRPSRWAPRSSGSNWACGTTKRRSVPPMRACWLSRTAASRSNTPASRASSTWPASTPA